MNIPLENIFVLIQRKMYLAISLTVKIVPSDIWHVTIYLFFMHLEPHTSNECIFNRFDIEIRAHDFYPLKMILYLKNVLCPYHLYCDIMKRKNSYDILVDHTCAFYNLTSFLLRHHLEMTWYDMRFLNSFWLYRFLEWKYYHIGYEILSFCS